MAIKEQMMDKQMLSEMRDRLDAARQKVWEAQREEADAKYEALKFVFERGWFDLLKLDEARLRRFTRS